MSATQSINENLRGLLTQSNKVEAVSKTPPCLLTIQESAWFRRLYADLVEAENGNHSADCQFNSSLLTDSKPMVKSALAAICYVNLITTSIFTLLLPFLHIANAMRCVRWHFGGYDFGW